MALAAYRASLRDRFVFRHRHPSLLYRVFDVSAAGSSTTASMLHRPGSVRMDRMHARIWVSGPRVAWGTKEMVMSFSEYSRARK